MFLVTYSRYQLTTSTNIWFKLSLLTPYNYISIFPCPPWSVYRCSLDIYHNVPPYLYTHVPPWSDDKVSPVCSWSPRFALDVLTAISLYCSNSHIWGFNPHKDIFAGICLEFTSVWHILWIVCPTVNVKFTDHSGFSNWAGFIVWAKLQLFVEPVAAGPH